MTNSNALPSDSGGTPTPDDFDDLVDEWHDTDTGMELHEFMAKRLGWTPDDVKRWVENPRYRPTFDAEANRLDDERVREQQRQAEAEASDGV